MLKIIGDFEELEKKYREGKVSFEDFQKAFSESRLHGLSGDIYPFAIGGSDASAIFGLNPFVSPRLLISRKLDPAKYEEVITPDKRYILDLGHHFEDGIAHMCAERLQDEIGKEVELIPSPLQYLNTDYPHCLADIDYLAKIDGLLYLIEVKSTRPFTDAANTFQMNAVPSYYNYQVQYYLEVLKDMKLVGAYLFAGWGFNPEEDFREIFIPRDADLGKKILIGCEETVAMAEKGVLPSNESVLSAELIKKDSAIMFGTSDPKKPAKKLKGKEEKDVLLLSEKKERLKNIKKELRDIQKEKETTSREESLEKEKDSLTLEIEKLTGHLLQNMEGSDGGYIDGEEKAMAIDIKRDFSVDKAVKLYIKEKHPEIYDEIRKISPKASLSLKEHSKE